MSEIPDDLRYTESHEWVRLEDDGLLTVGITDHAQSALGDLVFVEPPETGRALESGEACAVVESVKAASDIYAPVAGEVAEVNEALADSPELINSDPYGEGWILRLRPEGPAALDELLGAEDYQHHLAAEE